MSCLHIRVVSYACPMSISVLHSMEEKMIMDLFALALCGVIMADLTSTFTPQESRVSLTRIKVILILSRELTNLYQPAAHHGKDNIGLGQVKIRPCRKSQNAESMRLREVRCFSHARISSKQCNFLEINNHCPEFFIQFTKQPMALIPYVGLCHDLTNGCIFGLGSDNHRQNK